MKKALLALAALGFIATAQAQTTGCNELFFSEYVEGSGNSKAMEIYNPTANPVTLSNYRIVRYSNGSPTGVDSLTLSGTIASRDVWVVANGQTTSSANSPACDPALQALADQLGNVYPDPLYMNGDDAIALVRIQPYAIIDIFGKIGEDPGSSWSDVFPYTDAQGAWWTRDHTLIRKASVTAGVTVNPTAFNVTAEYDSLPENTWTNLGQHDCACNTLGIAENVASGKVTVFPNPANGQINVVAGTNITDVTIYNILGQSILVKDYDAAEQKTAQKIDLTGFAPGVYMVEVKTASGKVQVVKITQR
jgi:Secretion system C-terminal sorting domain/Lamin Tail Domain